MTVRHRMRVERARTVVLRQTLAVLDAQLALATAVLAALRGIGWRAAA